ncbi:phage tail protein [Streptomyces spiramenti]|uniref:Phage tail protein n=1 Tax=Streptomyces spiramenti TaxID=2720606 RepID=A0ABX1ANL1_9ACTN|nr:phage tail protein [Streptomyces spiramenti]NJP68663.1 phage tail protein [Streptomyces spiramenti]
MSEQLDPGTTVFFSLSIDGESLGYFNECEGLSAQVETEQRQEGGNNGFVWQLPTRVTYSTIRLTRPLTPETAQVAKWISSVTTGVTRPTAQIQALRADGSEVVSWGLIDVLPVSWQGPTLNSSSPAVANEVLEIAHHGFTD